MSQNTTTLKEAASAVLFHFWNCDMQCGKFRHSMAVLAAAVGYETHPGQTEEIAQYVGVDDNGFLPEERMTASDSTTPADSYDATVCIRCDPVRPENVGGTVWERCPECGAGMFGLEKNDA